MSDVSKIGLLFGWIRVFARLAVWRIRQGETVVMVLTVGAFALIAGVVMAASSLWAACLQIAAVYFSPDTFAANGLSSIFDAFVFVQGGLGYAPVAIFLFAAAHSMRRHESAPQWLAMLGYLASFGATLATFSIFFSYGDMAPGGAGPGIVGALPAAAWLIATGVVLIQNKRGSAATSTSAAS